MIYKKLKSIARIQAAVLTIVSSTLLLSSCVTNTEGGLPQGWVEITPPTVPEIQAMVPPEIAADGKIIIGSNPPFAPAEFKDSQGNIIGFDIDLARAVASIMGLELEINDLDFSLILPAVSGNTVDFGASGFTDNEERRKNYDFVNYLNAGIQWAGAPDATINPDDACGLIVAVQRTTISDTVDVNNRNDKCLAEGKPAIEKQIYESSDLAATAVALGKADAFSADSPVTAWAVLRSEGRMELKGEIFDDAHYGWPVKKDSDLAPALAAALQHLIDTGDYQKIMNQWGITEGQVNQAMINGTPVE